MGDYALFFIRRVCCKKCPSINYHLRAGKIQVIILLRSLPFPPKNRSIGHFIHCIMTIWLAKFFRIIINLVLQIERNVTAEEI